MKGFKIFLLPGIAVLFSLSAFSQTSNGKLRGFIYTPEDEPSLYSTIVLMNKDTVFVKGTVTNNDGSFQFDKIDTGLYFILVRNVEFNTYFSNPIVFTKDETITLDTIKLETKMMSVEEIVIKGEKSIVEVYPDKMVYNVSNSINASGNNGLELLGKTPGVMVDLDKNIVLQGKSGVKIYINGRPSRLAGSDLTNMLEGIQSDNIESIEILTNPSAEHEAEGSAGIIDIKMKKSGIPGFNGNINGSYSKGKYARSDLGTMLNFGGDKVLGYANFNTSKYTLQDDYIQTTLREKYILDMTSKTKNTRNGLNLFGGLEYKINSESVIGFDANALFNSQDNKVESNTRIIDKSGDTPSERLYSRVTDDYPSNNFNMDLYYNFVPGGSSDFSAELSFGSYTADKYTKQPNTYYNYDDNQILKTVNNEYDANTGIDLMSAKIDYQKRINKLSLKTGARYSYVETKNKLAFYNIENNQRILVIDQSNHFSYLEKIASAYLISGIKMKKNISLNIGLRVENTSSLGELVSANPSNNDVVARNYTNWFPNVSIAIGNPQVQTLSLNYGRRITRPNYQDLNPFENKLSELLIAKGNPFLKPSYITNYQIAYSFKRSFVVANNYSVTKDFFARIFEVANDKSSIYIPRNMNTVIINGLSVSYSTRILPWWNFNTFFIYNYSKYEGNFNGTKLNLESNIYNFRMQNNLNLPADIKMELTFYASSPWIYRGSVYLSAFQSLNLGLKHEFLKKRLLVQLRADDLLRTRSDFNYHSNYGGMKINGLRTFDNQRFGVSATYKFGNQKLKRIQKVSGIDEELKRISGESLME